MQIIGHRGAAGLAPENTLQSIQAALRAGVDAVEVDVRVTSDGMVVLCHDKHIVDATGAKQLVRKNTYKVLKKINPDLALLSEALKIVAGTCQIIVEIKPGEPCKPIVAVLQDESKKSNIPAGVAFASFDVHILQHIRHALPEIPLIVCDSWSGVRATRRARRLGTAWLFMNERWLWRGFVRMMQQNGFRLSVYTVDNPKRIARWQPFLYGVITNHPERFHRSN